MTSLKRSMSISSSAKRQPAAGGELGRLGHARAEAHAVRQARQVVVERLVADPLDLARDPAGDPGKQRHEQGEEREQDDLEDAGDRQERVVGLARDRRVVLVDGDRQVRPVESHRHDRAQHAALPAVSLTEVTSLRKRLGLRGLRRPPRPRGWPMRAGSLDQKTRPRWLAVTTVPSWSTGASAGRAPGGGRPASRRRASPCSSAPRKRPLTASCARDAAARSACRVSV